MATIGERIKEYREKKGLSQRQLKQLSGVHEIQIAKYETNKSTPTVATLKKLAKALEIPYSYLLDDKYYDDWNNQPNMTIGKRIRRYREEIGILSNELASKCNISESLLNQIEEDKTAPSLDTIKQIADVVKKPYSYLLPDDWHELKGEMKNGSIDLSLYLSKQDLNRHNELKEKHLLAGSEITDYEDIIEKATYEFVVKREYPTVVSNTNPLLIKLIELFNQLNEDGQEKALEQVNLIVKIEDYQIKK